MKKNIVIDTNVLMSDGSALKKFEKDTVHIPFIVLQELDNHKTDKGDTGYNTRTTIKFLDALREKGSLSEGVKLDNGSIIKVCLHDGDKDLVADDQIIYLAQKLKNEKKKNVVLVSNDLNVRVKADIFKIKSEGFNKDRLFDDPDELYTGHMSLEVYPQVIDEMHKKGMVVLDDDISVFPNQFIRLTDLCNTQHTSVGKIEDGQVMVPMVNHKKIFGVSPRNAEQKMALDLLMDEEIPLVTLEGLAGSGKTLLSVAAGLDQIMEKKKYNKLVFIKPMVAVTEDGIGYLPGGELEKVLPYCGSLLDSIGVFFSDQNPLEMLQMLMDQSVVEIVPLALIRGRSFNNQTFLVLDECQQLTKHEAKTLVSRMGEGSKLVCTGDTRQIDVKGLSAGDNGFSHIVDVFKRHEVGGHIQLVEVERGSLAKIAAQEM